MNSLAASISALALVVTAPAAQERSGVVPAHETAPQTMLPRRALSRAEPEPFRSFRDSVLPPIQDQVHIEQRVTIRIGPGLRARDDVPNMLPRLEAPTRYREKKLKGCIAIDDIAGAQPADDNRLLLFMRDHRILSAALERACDADAFYLGFYVARKADGMLCSKRDKLQARTGASCEVAQLNTLTALKD